MGDDFDPNAVNLTTVDPALVTCYLQLAGNEYNGYLGERVSALFVILIVSTIGTFFPVIASRVPRFKVPLTVYLFARYFGSGVIIATAFIHLLDPAYGEIGPASCVGMTGGWASYSWPPAIAMASIMLVFSLEFMSEYYVEKRYGLAHGHKEVEDVITTKNHQHLHSSDQDEKPDVKPELDNNEAVDKTDVVVDPVDKIDIVADPVEASNSGALRKLSASPPGEKGFREQIAAFLILEFGVLFHSIIIGLNLGVCGDEFFVLYPVLVFHQTFEGLGLGARMSAIPFPADLSYLPWLLCLAYGLTTPIAIAIGLGVRNTYSGGDYGANVAAGVLDSISAGILIYTGLVEMLARDFLFNPNRTRDPKRLAFMLITMYSGIALMALIGKWA